MIIKSVAIGNDIEAYIENRFSKGTNIIFSDDNNKGKTIVIQSIMYALGNEPAFPASFDYKNYTYYMEFEIENKRFQICRKGGSFVLKNNDIIMIFDNVSELKRYWDKHIFTMPKIEKNNILRIVDPVLFVQLFFVGQDKKDTSNITNRGLYNKNDFKEMIFSLAGIESSEYSQEETDSIKDKIRQLKDEKKVLLKENKILKSKNLPVTYLSITSDRMAFEAKMASMEKCRSKIETLRKERNNLTTRRAKWETTLKELRSLNRTMDCGELRCMDCNSTNISFTTGNGRQASYAFDVSTVELRKEIIESVQEKISSYDEEIERVSIQISAEQEKLQEIMGDESVTLEALLYYKADILSAKDTDKRIREINTTIDEYESRIKKNVENVEDTNQRRTELYSAIIEMMNNMAHQIDKDTNANYGDLFTAKSELYSGSEATVYHIVKLLALQNVLKHEYPIIVDSFRAEDLSSTKEALILNMFESISNQVILTTTLKDEEDGKYVDMNTINSIDYGNHAPNKLLSPAYVDDFKMKLNEMSIEA